MNKMFHDLVQSLEGIAILYCAIMVGVGLGISVMLALDWKEKRERARLARSRASRPRTTTQVISPGTLGDHLSGDLATWRKQRGL